MGNLYPIRGVGVGGGVRPKAEKKIVSVGAISTFRHPLGCVWSAKCECDGPSVSMIAWSDSDSVAFGISSSHSY